MVSLCVRYTSLIKVFSCSTVYVICLNIVTRREIKDFPNIVFVLADDLGYGDVGYNGGPAETPTLDAMASGPHSIQFTRFYSGAPVCSPTRGTLLTGRNHNRYCIWTANIPGQNCKYKYDLGCPTKMPLPTSEVTVAEILRDHGYHTATFGKWHLGDLKPAKGSHPKWPTSHPGQHGFDVWKVTKRIAPTVNPNCACFNSSLCHLGHYKTKPPPPCTNYYSGGKEEDVNTLITHRKPIMGDDSYFIVREFENFLEQAVDLGKPFFVYIAFHAVHKRYIAVSPYIEKYSALHYSEEAIDYYGSITAMDTAIGNIRTLLRQHNVEDNTMLWFVSDNGPEENTPGRTAGLRGQKGSLYEGGIRVPGIIEWPQVIKHNRISAYPVVTSDFLPTICDILGTSLPQDRILDGISVLPVILGKSEWRHKPIAWAFNTRGHFNGNYNMALVDNHLKVYADINDGRVSRAALYDLSNDPAETQDLSTEKSETFKIMLERLELWIQSVFNSAMKEVGCMLSAP